MKVWIDLTNSPHINFFKHFINDWKQEGCEIIITCRDLANTIDLIELNGWDYEVVGGHAGKNAVKKVMYFPNRVNALRDYLKPLKPDVGISHSSFYSPLTAKFLGIPSIYLNDNEHASGNYLAFIFANKNFLPECLQSSFDRSALRSMVNMEYYPGIKEGIYLCKEDFQIENGEKEKRRMYIRPEPWTAQYYKGDEFFIDKLLLDCKDEFEIILLPRGTEQGKYYMKEEFNGITVQTTPLTLQEISKNCDIFVGAGGTMTREIAFLGIPTISIYQSDLLEVDKYLIEHKYLLHETRLKKEQILDYLKSKESVENTELYEKGKQAYNLIKNSIYEFKR